MGASKTPYLFSIEDRYSWRDPTEHDWVDPDFCEYPNSDQYVYNICEYKDDEDYDIFVDDDYIPHICKKCSSNKNVKTVNEKINKSKDQTEFISKELNISLNNLCYCTKCKKVYTYNMGLLKNNKFICYYCDDLSKNPKYENATDYYRQVCNEMDEYNKRKE